MSHSFPDLVGQAGAYSTTGPKVDLSGGAKDDHRTFAAAVTAGDLADTDTVYVIIKKDATNLLVWEATFNDAATDNVTRVTELAAIGTISNTDAVDVYVCNAGTNINLAHRQSLNYFVGGDLIYTSATRVQLGPGAAMVEDTLLEWTSNLDSGTLGQADAGLSAVGRWNWYLYDNAGTPALEFSQTVSVEDNTRGYYYKSGDTTRRWVGWHTVYLDTTRKIYANWGAHCHGNIIRVGMDAELGFGLRIVNDATPLATTLTACGTAAGGISRRCRTVRSCLEVIRQA